MATFVNVFILTAPTGASAANAIDSYILEGVKKALDERYSLEHVSLSSAESGADDPDNANAQGRHIPGKVSCMFYGTYTELTALTAPGHGAIGYASDTGNFYRYDSGSGWLVLAVTSDTTVPDDITLEITGTTGGGAGIFGMKHDNQQWTTTVALVDGANIATECNDSNSFSVTLGGNRTLDNPTNQKQGATYVWIITQGPAGSHTLSYGTNFKWPGGVAPVLSTTAGAVDIITAISDGTNLLCSVNYDLK